MPPTIVQFMHDMTFENTGPELELLDPKWESNWMWTGTAAASMVRPRLQNQFLLNCPHSCFQVQCPYT